MGIVELTHRRPKTKEEVERNPLGLYVTHFSINERQWRRGGEEGGSK